MESPSILIAALISASSLARDAFRLRSNTIFTTIPSAADSDDGSTRESTPAADIGESTIYITTNHKSFDPLDGFVFGSADQDEVDIFLGSNEGSGVSRKHFSLRHNWEMGGFVLFNHSKFGTEVMTSSGVMKLDSQSLSLASGDVITAGSAKMRITYPKREKGSRHESAFRANWEKEYDEWQAGVPHADQLSLGESTNPTFPTNTDLELLKRIGQSLSSTIWQARDSSGRLYAIKAPNQERFKRNITGEINALERVQHVSNQTFPSSSHF